MFVGHLSVAFLAKKFEPRLPLSALVASAFCLDLIWPFLLLIGLESVKVDPGNTAFTALDFAHYPWSHSLLISLAWGVLAGFLAVLNFGGRRAFWIVCGVVVSHWLLDFITHRPDLPLWPFGPKVGLGLWHSVTGTAFVEGSLFAWAVVMYTQSTQPLDGVGRWSFWALIFFVGIIWISQPWSPPPPNPQSVAFVSLAMWMLPLWTHWIERHRFIRKEVTGNNRP